MSKKDVVERFFAAGERDDVATAADCFSPDGVWTTAAGPEPGTTYHRDEIPAFLAKMIGVRKEYEAKGITVTYGDLAEAGDKVYLEVVVTSAAGKVLDRAIDVFTVRDGKIVVKDVYRKA